MGDAWTRYGYRRGQRRHRGAAPSRQLAYAGRLFTAVLTGIATALSVATIRSLWSDGFTRGETPGEARWILECPDCHTQELRVDLPDPESDEWTCRRDGRPPTPKMYSEIRPQV
jgi:hypothetical protein